LARSVVRTITSSLIVWMLAAPNASAQSLSIVSANPGGTAAGALADSLIAITPDEQYIAFCSAANSLDPTKTDTNGMGDVYRRHLPTGVTTLVSVNTTGTAAGNGGCPGSGYVRISTDGRYVAFISEATNLVSGIADATAHDIFVRDMQTGTTTLATVNAAGTAAAGTNAAFDFSDDGRRVVFESYATTLVAGFVDGNAAGFTDVFQRDLQTNTTRLISATHLDPVHGGNGPSWLGVSNNFNVMSADGRYVAFLSTASDVINGHATVGQDLFVRDTQANVTKLGDDLNPFDVFNLTADGRFLAFNENSSSIWVRDLETNTRIHVSVNATNTGEANGVSNVPFISRYPRTAGQLDYVVAFRSMGSDLVSGVTKTNGAGLTIYARTLGPGGTTVLAGGVPDGTATGNGDDFIRDISPDGRYVIFFSTSTNIVAGLTDTSIADLFRRDLVTSTTIVLSVAQPSGATGAGAPLWGLVGQIG
jgi:hypothetical protein